MSSSNDPVSEFLAREQTALADLGEDFVMAPEPLTPAAQTDNFGQNGFLNGGDLPNGTSRLVGDNMTAQNPPFFDADGSQGGMSRTRTSPTLSNSRSQSTQPEEEPEKIRKWREQQKELIEKKDKEEEKKKEELRQQAKKELDQIYAQRNAQLEQRKKQNRERQTGFNSSSAKSEEKDTSGAMWERVARMIEGNPGSGGAGGIGAGKSSKATGQSSALGKDTSRMKNLIMLYARGEQTTEKSPSPEIP